MTKEEKAMFGGKKRVLSSVWWAPALRTGNLTSLASASSPVKWD